MSGYRNYELMADMVQIDFRHDGVNRLAAFMASYADKDGRGVFPCIETLMKRMGRDRRTIQRHIKKLRDAGVIFEVVSVGKSACYHFNMAVVRLLLRGIVKFCELVGGKVTILPDDETQLVLPGLEGDAPPCMDNATGLPPQRDRIAAQSNNLKTIPGAPRMSDDLEKKMISAAGDAVDPDHAHGLRDMSEVLGWLENGADLELDVLPAVTARSKGKDKGAVYSWAYYRKAVMSAFVRRTAVIDLDEFRSRKAAQGAMGTGKAGAGKAVNGLSVVGAAGGDDIRDRNLRAAIELFKKTGYWDDQFGAKPDLSTLADRSTLAKAV